MYLKPGMKDSRSDGSWEWRTRDRESDGAVESLK